MVCGRVGCTACLLLIGTEQSAERRGGNEGWTSTGGAGFPGVWGAGFVAKGKVNEAKWTAELSKRWVCSWDCFDKWAAAQRESNAPLSEGRGHVTYAGLALSREAAERLRLLGND